MLTAIAFVCGILAGFAIAAYLIVNSTNETEISTDNETPDFTRRSGEGLENIKKYGIWF